MSESEPIAGGERTKYKVKIERNPLKSSKRKTACCFFDAKITKSPKIQLTFCESIVIIPYIRRQTSDIK